MTTTSPASLSDAQYQTETRRVLACIEACVDRWLQDDVVDIDASRTGGMLELVLPNRSKLIVNTQPPLQEIWLAARRGGYHYRWVNGRWLDAREGTELFAQLSLCASEQAGLPLAFKPDPAAPGG